MLNRQRMDYHLCMHFLRVHFLPEMVPAAELAGSRCVVVDGALSARVAAALRESRGGRNLIQLGMDDDLAWAADVDRLAIVPRFDPHTKRIEALVQ